MLPNWVFAGLEKSLHERLVNNGYAFGRWCIGRGEGSAANDVLPDCLEEVWAGAVEDTGHVFALIRRGLPLDVHVETPGVAFERRVDR